MNVSDLPDDALVPMKWVRVHFVPRVSGEKRDMTARECSIELGHSRDWWQDRARSGLIVGAYQAGERGRWYIPREAATVYLDEIRKPGSKKRRQGRTWGRARPAA